MLRGDDTLLVKDWSTDGQFLLGERPGRKGIYLLHLECMTLVRVTAESDTNPAFWTAGPPGEDR